MFQQQQFPFQGKEYLVQVGGLDQPSFIQSTDEYGDTERLLVDYIRASDAEKQVSVIYQHQPLNRKGEPTASYEQRFPATQQETFMYFYYGARTGQQLQMMCLNGISEHILGPGTMPLFGNDEKFYRPFQWTHAVLPSEGSTAEKPLLDLSVSVEYPLPETYSYRLTRVWEESVPLEERTPDLPTQETPLFTSLAPGTYTLAVTSLRSWPRVKTIVIAPPILPVAAV